MTALAPRKLRGIGKDGRELESKIQADIRRAFAKLPYVLCYRNNTGSLRDANGMPVHFGLAPGSSDLIGSVRTRRPVYGTANKIIGWCAEGYGHTRPFALEVKRPGEKPTHAQVQFLGIVRSHGWGAGWCDNVDDALRLIEVWRNCEDS